MKGSRDEYPLSAGILSLSPLTCSSTPPILPAASHSTTFAHLNFEKYTRSSRGANPNAGNRSDFRRYVANRWKSA